MDINILGISAYYHDSAAALVANGKLIAAAEEERFTRKKNDSSFPSAAISYCLDEAGLSLREIDYVVYYDKPFIKFERFFETIISNMFKGFKTYLYGMPKWFKETLFIKKLLVDEFKRAGFLDHCPPILFSSHHQAHAASAFYPSPFERAAVLCVDGVGEWSTTSVWLGELNKLTPQWELRFPHSVGLLYSAFTYYCGFKVNSGEYKLMGLAPYGEACYTDLIKEHLIDIKADGTYRLNLDYFSFESNSSMINSKFNELFGGDPRKPEGVITRREMNLASSIQRVIEEVMLKLANSIYKEFQMQNLCLAGGVALNCVANGKLLQQTPFKKIWVQPAANDAGGAVGAAYLAWCDYLRRERIIEKNDSMKGSYLGPSYTSDEIKSSLDAANAVYVRFDEDSLLKKTAEVIADGSVVGWFQGRMEFGPRALGCRSILGDPRNPDMQRKLNLKIKKRESFRPFAPAVIEEECSEYFDLKHASPYMQFVALVASNKWVKCSNSANVDSGLDKLKMVRSTVPAITHVDYSARVQTVNKQVNEKFYRLLQEFKKITGCPVLVNTSFNVRGEPIVCTPEDAFRCFMNTEMDYLIIGNYFLSKNEQTNISKDSNEETKFRLD